MDRSQQSVERIVNRSMPPGTIIPELAYDDLEAAVSWLCIALGFKERLRIGAHRSQLVLGGSSIVVTAKNGSAGVAVSAGTALGISQAGTSDQAHSIMIRVTNLEEHFERVRQSGVKIVHVPETYPYGERQYTIQDMCGHAWIFSQSVADVAAEIWGGRFVDI